MDEQNFFPEKITAWKYLILFGTPSYNVSFETFYSYMNIFFKYLDGFMENNECRTKHTGQGEHFGFKV